MKARPLIALLLTCALVGPTLRPAGAQEGGPTKCRSAGDECEAARLAVRLVTRLREAGDASPVVDEFFLPDFAERFQKFIRAGDLGENYELLFVGVSRETLTGASPADLRRAFVALVNAWHHGGEFSNAVSDVTEARHNLASVLADDNWRLRKAVEREALPPALLEVCKGDPLLAMVAEAFSGGGDEEDEDEDEDEAAQLAQIKSVSVQSVERLRSFTEKLEKCVALMREATKKLREELKAYPGRDVRRTTRLDDVYRVETGSYAKETLGLPARTPFIQARLHPYVVVIVPVEGQLKVIGILPDFDGD
jgi:hypothetical protein